jgi:hypothetical protein
METSAPLPPPINISSHLYLQLVYTLTDLLPPPLDTSPDALRARNSAAIAKVAAMLPFNANEADLAAQTIAARAQAEDILRLLRENADDLALVIRLNAQYASMLRTSLSVHARLMRVQAVRQKRESIEGAANQDSRTQYVTERAMLQIVDRQVEWLEEASPQAAPAEVPTAGPTEAQVAAPTPHEDHWIGEHVSEHSINSQDVAFETWMSAQPWNHGPESQDEPGLRKRIREAMAGSHLAGRELPANRRESPGRTG